MYFFCEWKDLYEFKKETLQFKFDKETKAVLDEVERYRRHEDCIGIINQIERRILMNLKPLVRNLYGFGILFPLEIKDLPLAMLNFDYERHKEELERLEDVLVRIRLYLSNKENLAPRRRCGCLLDILNKINYAINP